MSDIIRLLPDAIANQIAAGEVVQRPASVVKELLENAVDAHSTHIQLIVKDAGKLLIQVVDNGIGMSETDARMSLERHATSKIQKIDDLFNLRTFGFRGEALASIAAVAQVEIRTRQPQDTLGTRLVAEGSQVSLQEPVATPAGTIISVRNLFFNVPARRNFLKSNPVELRHIIEEFQRVALANPQIAFSFFQNDMKVMQLKGGNLAQRITGIFGKNYREILLACHENLNDISLKGYVGKPEAARKTRGEQFFFVNNRFIKHGYLHHAVMSAYEQLLPDDTFPFYVLFIEIDPARIDVNVHPTKTEVKFDDERTLYSVILAAVKQSLGKHHLAPSIDFDLDANFMQPGQMQWQPESPELSKNEYNAYKDSVLRSSRSKRWEQLFPDEQFQERMASVPPKDAAAPSFFDNTAAPPHEESLHQSGATTKLPTTVADDAAPQPVLFQLHRQYIVSQVKSGMMLIRQQAAHERIIYEKVLQKLQSPQAASQQLLFPIRVKLSPSDFVLFTEIQAELQALGFVTEILQGQSDAVLLKGTPADLPGLEDSSVLEGLLEQFKHNSGQLQTGRQERMAYAIARRTALRLGTALSSEEMHSIINQLFACAVPHYAPDGSKTLTIVRLEQLANFFQ